ncbi:arylamine N-acetyltransferase family protein [Actinoplanes derwentensis]|uniref:Arylamine N-acetyltransferase n=1 Tax=Actinoplanes derwentensis TaxID=113562 RepID=A0A1H2BI19_9ACTN|nr:arylamine N-acetyltransferase [Actinoplanes derwentensis]GID87822.1 arylamine N-acetyltransferase [Actinoplanes derwentensis]SDT57672.1 Arylamine N-acetyltransferase [Actinoplanes derwentensis]
MPETIDPTGYLTRLGLPELAGHQPGVAALSALHRAHAERVPYEVLEIHLGRPTTVCPLESARRIVAGRGGYCYHLNGAFSVLLRALGYAVTRHVGGVQGQDAEAGASGNHLVLTVSGLPSAESPDGQWLVDLGMGDGLHGPLPLVAGVYEQGPFRYTLRPSEAEPGGWRFDHDPAGSFRGMDFRTEKAMMSDFAVRHVELSTSETSGFVRTPMAARRDATGADILRGRNLSRIGAAAALTELVTAADYFAALDGVFGMTFDEPERAVLWARASAAHERWLRERTT